MHCVDLLKGLSIYARSGAGGGDRILSTQRILVGGDWVLGTQRMWFGGDWILAIQRMLRGGVRKEWAPWGRCSWKWLFSNKETRSALTIFQWDPRWAVGGAILMKMVCFPIRKRVLLWWFSVRSAMSSGGGDLYENGCFPIRKRAAPGRNHSMKSFPAFKIDHWSIWKEGMNKMGEGGEGGDLQENGCFPIRKRVLH